MEQNTRKRSSSGKSSSGKSSAGRSASGRSSSSRSNTSGRSGSRTASYETTRSRSTGSGKHRKGKRAAARKRRRMIIFGVEALVLVCLIGVLFFVSKLDKMQSGDMTAIASGTNVEEDLSNIEVKENENLTEETAAKMEGYTTIALFGVDSRTGILGKGSRSDTIIIASINNATKDVKLCSVYRDTYLNMANGSYNKANGAYAFGGPDQAIQMLNLNLDLNISQYVAVDFTAIANVVDALGGIELEITDAEVTHLNNYTVETSEVVGRSTTKLPGAGTYNLDGIQAVSYCRIRYTKGDDFKRTERQRTVIAKIVEKAKTADLATLNKIIDDVFPQVATNLKATDVTAMAADILSYNISGSEGFPFDKTTGTFGSKGSCVVAADLVSNVEQLHSFLFDTEDSYTPSAKVEEISAYISKETGVTASN